MPKTECKTCILDHYKNVHKLRKLALPVLLFAQLSHGLELAWGAFLRWQQAAEQLHQVLLEVDAFVVEVVD